MMTHRRHYSLAEASRALPEVAGILRELRELQARAVQTKERLDLLWQRLDSGEPVLGDLAALQERFDADMNAIRRLLTRLGEMDVVLRDLGRGLVDFPAAAGGTEFYLCWHLGEDGIQYWHGLEEGFAGRKPLWTMPGGPPHYA